VENVQSVTEGRQVAVIGCGYVGLVTGVALAHIGHSVICVDVDQDRITRLQRGECPIYEPGLEAMLSPLMSAGRLAFTTDLVEAVDRSGIIFICVGTPMSDTGAADMSAVEKVADEIGHCIDGSYRIIIDKSTVPVGTADMVTQRIHEAARENARRHGFVPDIDVVSSPEFLREGSALLDTLYPSRIVIGARSERAALDVEALYARIIDGDFELPGLPRPSDHRLPVPVATMDPASAEMLKYAANSFLALKISFINEMAAICERVGADVTQVAKGIGFDPRIGHPFLKAGIGWGGSCFLKDLSALRSTAASHGYDPVLLDAALSVNEWVRESAIVKLESELGTLEGKTIGLLGLSFKPNTDDLRDAPSLVVARRLIGLGVRVKAYDPVAMPRAAEALPGVKMVSDEYELAEGCDAIALITDWPQFRGIDLVRLKKAMRQPVFLDGRNQFDPARLKALGFRYLAFGR
jgi:UDPglucose 6-dehydrogenase